MIIEWVDPADLKPYVDLSAEDSAWIDAIIDRIVLTWGWEYERAEAEARRAVIEFYQRGEARQIEEALYQKRLAYEADNNRLRREAVQRTVAENQRRQRIAWEEECKEQNRLQQQRIAWERQERQRIAAEKQRRPPFVHRPGGDRVGWVEEAEARHKAEAELYRQQRATYRSLFSENDRPSFDYDTFSFYDAMLENARERDDDLIKGEMVDLAHNWRTEIDASCSEVEYDVRYRLEPDKFSWDDLLVDDWKQI